MGRLSAFLLIAGFFAHIAIAQAGTANHEAHHDHDHPKGIMIEDAQIRATTAQAGATAVYAHIHNHGKIDDKLIGAFVTFAKKTEIHEIVLDGDVMKMRELQGGIALPAGASVTLKNGAEHVMIMGLSEGISLGQSYAITFEFAQAGTLTVEAEAIPLSGKKAKAHNHDHGHDHSGHKH